MDAYLHELTADVFSNDFLLKLCTRMIHKGIKYLDELTCDAFLSFVSYSPDIHKTNIELLSPHEQTECVVLNLHQYLLDAHTSHNQMLYDNAKPADVSLNVLSHLPENHTYCM